MLRSRHVEYSADAIILVPAFSENSNTTPTLEGTVQTFAPQEIWHYTVVTLSTEDFRDYSSTFRDLAYWDLETINSTIQFIIHELHPPDVHVFLDIEIYPKEDENEISVKEYEGSCHPLHHDSSYYVIILYCKRSNDGNDHIMHYLFAVNDGLGQK